MQKMFSLVKNVFVFVHFLTFVHKIEKQFFLNLIAKSKNVRVCQKNEIEKMFPFLKIRSQIHTFFPF